jgi:hypothetical protein
MVQLGFARRAVMTYDGPTPFGKEFLMSDKTVLEHISALVEEEKKLREADSPAPAGRLKDVEEQLDQCWDLLRQRRARREFGDDPERAQVRDAGTVENYEG